MSGPIAFLSQPLAEAMAHALAQFLWQGLAIGISTWCVMQLLRAARPQLRYAVACVAMAACLWLPLQTAHESLRMPADMPSAQPAITVSAFDTEQPRQTGLATLHDALRTTTSPMTGATPWILALWGIGVVGMLLRLFTGLSWLQRVRRDARTPVPDPLLARWHALTERMGMHGRARLLLGDDDAGPFAAGFFRPVVVLPIALISRMPIDHVEALLAHELAHIRRHDYLVNLLQTLVESLLFYHPAVWWLSHRIRVERELIADDIAALTLSDPRRLASALSALDRFTAERDSPTSLAFAPAAQGGHLMTRIQHLIRPARHGKGARIALPAVALLAAGAACYAYATAQPPLQHVAKAPAPHASPQVAVAPKATMIATTAATHTRIGSRDGGRIIESEYEAYALVKAGSEGIAFSGDLDDVAAVRATRDKVGGDFVWFRRNGEAYIIRDPAFIARMEQNWATTSATEAKMEALGREMEAHSHKLEAMSEQMSALGQAAEPSEKMRDATRKIEQLAQQQARLAREQAAMAIGKDDAAQAAAETALDERMEALSTEIERLSEIVETESDSIASKSAPMEALAEKMEVAAAPMEALGNEMEALGAQVEREVAVIDRVMREEIERAVRDGRAERSPSGP